MTNWEQAEFVCPKCGNHTESATVPMDDPAESLVVGERCPHCRWQIDLSDSPRRVKYGTELVVSA